MEGGALKYSYEDDLDPDGMAMSINLNGNFEEEDAENEGFDQDDEGLREGGEGSAPMGSAQAAADQRRKKELNYQVWARCPLTW